VEDEVGGRVRRDAGRDRVRVQLRQDCCGSPAVRYQAPLRSARQKLAASPAPGRDHQRGTGPSIDGRRGLPRDAVTRTMVIFWLGVKQFTGQPRYRDDHTGEAFGLECR
jgi:hypothetical protein